MGGDGKRRTHREDGQGAGAGKLQTEAAVPTKDEILGSDGVWLVYTRARFVRSAVRVPRGRTVDEIVRELEAGRANS